ncbi:MAG: glycosyltransferase family 39 protein [Chromatiaceae bacterium]|nr:MAG: glycosyltransferase family 39 protein [Chromatiaceae bacterium]
MSPPAPARPVSPLTALLNSPWTLALVVWLAFFWQLGAVPLYDLDEGAFTEATREMLASGNYITPYRDGAPRYDKPVLIYWLQAASVRLLGFDEFALRLPSALAAALWVLALWRFVREHLDAATATVAGLVMALGLQVALIGKAAVADAVLNLFIALACFDIWRYWCRRQAAGAEVRTGADHWLLARVSLWLGLGFLTKGPVAILFPLLASLLYALTSGGWRTWLEAVLNPRGWLVFLLVAAPWYLAVWMDSGPGFWQGFFLDHNLGRYGGVKHGHAGFPGYYLVMLPIVLLPFTGWFLSLLPMTTRLWADPLDRFLLLWFATVFVVFSFSATKLPHYLVYGITPLFILMARHRWALTRPWLAFAPPLLLFTLLVLLPWLLAPLAGSARRAHEVAQFAAAAQVLDWRYALGAWAALLLVLGLALATPARALGLWQRLVLVGIIQTVLVFGLVVPRVFAVMQAPVREAALVARALDLPTVVFRTSLPSFSVYRQAITPSVEQPRPGQLVFLRIDKLEQLAAAAGDAAVLVPVYQRGPVALVRIATPAAANLTTPLGSP